MDMSSNGIERAGECEIALTVKLKFLTRLKW